ncbi:hypothetical protein [uncultured Bradyrhizobium sp.]|uniref:hypothetical protein n=1 Tax=uncultured Bradyrhizobium sp. TaxID=199684 RepID=UPI002624787C|nr:hypothetical protein [uncultured Bradyrhizobium sp.]
MSQMNKPLLDRYEAALERFLENRSAENRLVLDEVDAELRQHGIDTSPDFPERMRKAFNRWNYGIKK